MVSIHVKLYVKAAVGSSQLDHRPPVLIDAGQQPRIELCIIHLEKRTTLGVYVQLSLGILFWSLR